MSPSPRLRPPHVRQLWALQVSGRGRPRVGHGQDGAGRGVRPSHCPPVTSVCAGFPQHPEEGRSWLLGPPKEAIPPFRLPALF